MLLPPGAHVLGSGENARVLFVDIGVAAVALAEESTDALVSRADAAMYEGKERGRNQVITINGTSGS